MVAVLSDKQKTIHTLIIIKTYLSFVKEHNAIIPQQRTLWLVVLQ